MKINSVEFVKSVASIDQVPKEKLNEIAFAGRSNVGKSSLINCLLNRKKMAKTSSTPGKTRYLNYFKINDRFHFVDLPGYGFAKVSQSERQQWRNLIESFLQGSENLKGVVSIIDSRIGATQLDLQLLDWLKSLAVPVLLVATKADKLSKSAVTTQIRKLNRELSEYTAAEVIPFSATKGAGKKELMTHILSLLE